MVRCMTTALCGVLRDVTTVKVLSVPGHGFRGKNTVSVRKSLVAAKVGGGRGGRLFVMQGLYYALP